MKRCSKCMWAKPLTEFYANRATADRLGSWCKQCEAQRAKARRDYVIAYQQTEGYRAAQAKYRGSPKAKSTVSAYGKRARAERRDRVTARWAINSKVRHGAVVRPPACAQCHTVARVQAHHHDYSKPLEVEWLCSKCHAAVHAARRA